MFKALQTVANKTIQMQKFCSSKKQEINTKHYSKANQNNKIQSSQYIQAILNILTDFIQMSITSINQLNTLGYTNKT